MENRPEKGQERENLPRENLPGHDDVLDKYMDKQKEFLTGFIRFAREEFQ